MSWEFDAEEGYMDGRPEGSGFDPFDDSKNLIIVYHGGSRQLIQGRRSRERMLADYEKQQPVFQMSEWAPAF
jgi:hypothetical protein